MNLRWGLAILIASGSAGAFADDTYDAGGGKVDPDNQIVTIPQPQQPQLQPQAPAPPECPVDDIEAQIKTDVDNCTNIHDAAESCCQNPSTCGSRGMMAGGSDMSKLMMMMVSMKSSMLMAQSSPGQMQDMSSLCNMYGGLTGGGGTMNGNVNSMCTTNKGQCSKACVKSFDYWDKQITQYGKTCSSYDKMMDARSTFRNMDRSCGDLSANRAVVGQANNFNGANQGAMQNVCSQLAMQPASQLQPLQPPQQMVDCTNPVLASSPACQACAQANLTGQPCTPPAQAVHDSGGSRATFQQSLTTSTNPGNYNVATPYDVTGQHPHYLDSKNGNQAGAADPMSGMNQMMNRGGGNQMFPGAFQGHPDPAAPVNRGSRTAYQTDILHGERGGGGYMGSFQVDTSGGGFQGYGAGSEQPQVAAGMDLKKYLPGHSMDPNRKVAGVGSASPEISSTVTDIFKRISDRFKLICSSNRLLDCEIP